MPEPWFRRRTPDQGQGYAPAGKEGWMVTAAFIVVATVTAVGPPMVGHGSLASFLLAGFLFCACLAALLLIVWRHSDWNN